PLASRRLLSGRTLVQAGPWRMRALLWIVVALVAVLGLVGFVMSLNDDVVQVGQPIVIAPKGVTTTQRSPEPSKFQVRDRVFHNQFGHGTVVAADGLKLTIEVDEGGVKRVLDGFVVRDNETPPDAR